MAQKDVIIKIVREDNETFLIDNIDWFIPSDGLSGFGSFSTDIDSVDNAIGDGGVITSERLKLKDRTVKINVVDAKKNEILRHSAIKFFVPHKTYKVYLTYMGYTRWCEGYLYKCQLSEGNIYKRMTLTFTIMCASPFLRSYDDFGEDIASVTGAAGFPYLCAIDHPIPTGIYNFTRDVRLLNDGDVATFCRVTMIADEEVENPKFIINDKYVRIIDTMVQGDVIDLDFSAQPPTVKKNGVNIIGKTDRTSTFNNMQLDVGDNTVSYTADSGDTNMRVSVYYNKLYAMI